MPSVASLHTIDLPTAAQVAAASSVAAAALSQAHRTESHASANAAAAAAAADTLDLDSMYLMLEPNLRPATPDPHSRVSQQIYDEHNEMAREYLKVRVRAASRVAHFRY